MAYKITGINQFGKKFTGFFCSMEELNEYLADTKVIVEEITEHQEISWGLR